MRIVQVITRPQRRGAEIFAVQLAEELVNLGHEVWVIALLKGAGGLDYSRGIIALNLDGKRRIDFYGFNLLANKLNEIKPDLVQANAADTLRYGVAAKFLSNHPFKLVYRNANTISEFIKDKSQLFYNRFLHANVDGVISVSEHSKNDYQKLFKAKSIQAIPIGINTNEIDNRLRPQESAIEGDYLLFIGSLVPEKDPLSLLSIFKNILQKYPGLKLVYLGSGPLKEELEAKTLNHGLAESVILIPNQKNIFPILTRAKALLMPSKNEGLPGVILEAMYCKVPVIAFGVGGIPEILISHQTGWLIGTGNPKKFEEAIGEVLNALPEELQKISISARELVLGNYQLDQIAKKFEDFYHFFLKSERHN
ncbi:glycosyltransferase family 4 protein [Algoriphagus aestuarii]|nr:glycosyltransferase family 4 protein [Algoriphagus aestuarii]